MNKGGFFEDEEVIVRKKITKEINKCVITAPSATKDSVEKIIDTYFACVTKQPFTFNKKTYTPKPLKISPFLFRGFTCPQGCGACCSRLTLDYLPTELIIPPSEVKNRVIFFNGKEYIVKSDTQEDSTDYHCKHLSRETGRCRIHDYSPFSADFELIRFLIGDTFNTLTQKLYGRGWAMLQYNKRFRGAMCTMTGYDEKVKMELLRKFKRLKGWVEYFEVESCVDEIIKVIETGPHEHHIIVNKPKKGLLR